MTSDTRIYDPFTHTVADDRYPIYRELRDEYPVYHCEEWGCWALSRFEDVREAARDPQRFSNKAGVELDMPAQYLGTGDFLDSDDPHHARLRKVLHDHFKPKVVAELAFPLPMLTILGLMGFPEEDPTPSGACSARPSSGRRAPTRPLRSPTRRPSSSGRQPSMRSPSVSGARGKTS